MAVYLGFDCGGTTCRAMALDDDGKVLHRGHAGPGNIATTSLGSLLRHLTQASRGCPLPDRVCGCFAGLLTDAQRADAMGTLQGLFPDALCRTEPDYSAAFAACDGDTDVLVIAGTGSIVCSRIDGKLVKKGGRGLLLGDVGSTAQIGREALVAYLDGCAPDLAPAVEEIFGTPDERSIVSAVYATRTPGALLAKLAPSVLKAYGSGRPLALGLVDRSLDALAAVAASHCHIHFAGAKRLKVVAAGGLWIPAQTVRSRFRDLLAERLPGITINLQRIPRPPVYGAALLARETL